MRIDLPSEQYYALKNLLESKVELVACTTKLLNCLHPNKQKVTANKDTWNYIIENTRSALHILDKREAQFLMEFFNLVHETKEEPEKKSTKKK